MGGRTFDTSTRVLTMVSMFTQQRGCQSAQTILLFFVLLLTVFIFSLAGKMSSASSGPPLLLSMKLAFVRHHSSLGGMRQTDNLWLTDEVDARMTRQGTLSKWKKKNAWKMRQLRRTVIQHLPCRLLAASSQLPNLQFDTTGLSKRLFQVSLIFGGGNTGLAFRIRLAVVASVNLFTQQCWP